jgi:hypothetical protein
MSAIMHADEEGDLLFPHAGLDVGQALLEVHGNALLARYDAVVPTQEDVKQ